MKPALKPELHGRLHLFCIMEIQDFATPLPAVYIRQFGIDQGP